MPLDSDIANPDSQLHVEFYVYDRDGPYRGKPFVRIVVPGDKTNVIDQPAREDHQRRFHRQWLHFQRQTGESNIVGTPLSQWHMERPDELTDGQLEELTVLKFLSVEQLATASDGQIMRVGMGGVGVRERARAYLSGKHAQASGAALEKAQDEIMMLKAAMERVLAAQSQQAAAPKEEVYKAGATRRAGWPKGKPRPKKKVSVNVQHNDAATGATSR